MNYIARAASRTRVETAHAGEKFLARVDPFDDDVVNIYGSYSNYETLPYRIGSIEKDILPEEIKILLALDNFGKSATVAFTMVAVDVFADLDEDGYE